jgi:hypothetical protein
MESTDFDVPHYAFVSSLLSLPAVFLGTLFSATLSHCSFLNVRDHMLHPYKRMGVIKVVYI